MVPLPRCGPRLHRPGLPWQNGVCESFNAASVTSSWPANSSTPMLEVQVLAEDWRTEYNTYRPHGSLHWLTPEAFHEQWITNRQPTLS
ncbi:MAG: transposase [Micromonosporaceae bacterium]|nr:transposase [Micromonosporaceae bacterium]